MTAEIGDQTCDATATTIDGVDRDPVCAMLTADHPVSADHKAATDRTIPVVALVRS